MAALASAYAGDLDRARALNDRWLAEATSPSRRAWATYYQAEIENLANRRDLAEQRYLEAITLGRNAGDTFVIGVATIGLFTLRTIDGREHEALAGYREVIELFARTGYWTHQWIALRNLATCCDAWMTSRPQRSSRPRPKCARRSSDPGHQQTAGGADR